MQTAKKERVMEDRFNDVPSPNEEYEGFESNETATLPEMAPVQKITRVVDRASDTENAIKFVNLFNHKYCTSNNKWLIYKEGVWIEDINLQRRIDADVITESSKLKNNLFTEAYPRLCKNDKDFDTNHMLLNVENGVVDLQTGKLLPHSPDYYFTAKSPVVYDEAAQCPKFLDFLESIQPEEEVRNYLQSAIGYTLTGKTSSQKFFFLQGGGANGKGTLLKIITGLMGGPQNYCYNAPEGFLVKCEKEHPTELMGLYKKRFVNYEETEEDSELNASRVKLQTGQNAITARGMHKDFVTFDPTHKIWMASNPKPIIKDLTDSIWNRLVLIEFKKTFTGDKRKEDLDIELLKESSGILNWAIQGCIKWQQEGLNEPASITLASKQYRLDSDPVQSFIKDCCTTNGNGTLKKEMFECFQNYYKKEHSGKSYKSTFKAFNLRLEGLGYKVAARDSDGIRWESLEVKEEYKPVPALAFEDSFATTAKVTR